MKENTTKDIDVYSKDTTVIERPESYNIGVKVGWTAPAKWWNWLFNACTLRLKELFNTTTSIHNEIKNAVGGTLDPESDTQLKDKLEQMKKELADMIAQVSANIAAFEATKAEPNGIASLDPDGRIPYSQLYIASDSKKGIVKQGALSTWSVAKQHSVISIGLYNVTYGKNMFVAVGSSGKIITSPDSITWTERTSPISNILTGITYGKNMFVAVGSSGKIITSPDSITWTERTSPISTMFTGITYGKNMFVAVGNAGKVITSPDSITWTIQSTPLDKDLNNVTYGNNMFVAVGESGKVITSPDSITWTERTSPISNMLTGITYGKNMFVAVGESGKIITSPDSITWTAHNNSNQEDLSSVTYGKNMFVAVGSNGVVLTYQTVSTNAVAIDADGNMTVPKLDELTKRIEALEAK